MNDGDCIAQEDRDIGEQACKKAYEPRRYDPRRGCAGPHAHSRHTSARRAPSDHELAADGANADPQPPHALPPQATATPRHELAAAAADSDPQPLRALGVVLPVFGAGGAKQRRRGASTASVGV